MGKFFDAVMQQAPEVRYLGNYKDSINKYWEEHPDELKALRDGLPQQEEAKRLQEEGNDRGFGAGFYSGLMSTYSGLTGMLQAAIGDDYTGQERNVGSFDLFGLGDPTEFTTAKQELSDAQEGFKRIEQEYAPTRVWTAEDIINDPMGYITSANGLRYNLGNMAGFAVGTAPLGGLGGLAAKGLVRAGMGAGSRVLGKTMIGKGMQTAGKALGSKVGTGAMAGAGSGVGEAIVEGGLSYRDLIENGVSPEEASDKAFGVMAKNLPTSALAGAAMGGVWGRNAERLMNPSTGNRLVNAGKAFLLGAPMAAVPDAIQEAVQEGISGQAKGEKVFDIYSPETWDNPWSQEQTTAALQALIGASLFGGVPSATSAAIRRPKQAETPTATASISSGNKDIDSAIEEAARETGLNPDLLHAVAQQESGYNPNAKSDAGAIGVMQLMPETANELGVDPTNARENILGGARYLKQMLDENDGDIEAALASYNGGLGGRNLTQARLYAHDVLEKFGNIRKGESTFEAPNGEGVTWTIKDGVDFTNVDPRARSVANIIADLYYNETGDTLIITEGKSDSDIHVKGGHDSGMKFDFAVNDDSKLTPEVKRKIEAKLDELGVKWINEYDNPSPNSTGGHFDVSVRDVDAAKLQGSADTKAESAYYVDDADVNKNVLEFAQDLRTKGEDYTFLTDAINADDKQAIIDKYGKERIQEWADKEAMLDVALIKKFAKSRDANIKKLLTNGEITINTRNKDLLPFYRGDEVFAGGKIEKVKNGWKYTPPKDFLTRDAVKEVADRENITTMPSWQTQRATAQEPNAQLRQWIKEAHERGADKELYRLANWRKLRDEDAQLAQWQKEYDEADRAYEQQFREIQDAEDRQTAQDLHDERVLKQGRREAVRGLGAVLKQRQEQEDAQLAQWQKEYDEADRRYEEAFKEIENAEARQEAQNSHDKAVLRQGRQDVVRGLNAIAEKSEEEARKKKEFTRDEKNFDDFINEYYPNNEKDEVVDAILEKLYQEQANRIIETAEQLRGEVAKGVDIVVPADGDGRGIRVSKNEEWYKKLLNDYGVSTWKHIKKGNREYALLKTARDMLLNGDKQYEGDPNYIELEDTISGIEAYKTKLDRSADNGRGTRGKIDIREEEYDLAKTMGSAIEGGYFKTRDNFESWANQTLDEKLADDRKKAAQKAAETRRENKEAKKNAETEAQGNEDNGDKDQNANAEPEQVEQTEGTDGGKTVEKSSSAEEKTEAVVAENENSNNDNGTTTGTREETADDTEANSEEADNTEGAGKTTGDAVNIILDPNSLKDSGVTETVANQVNDATQDPAFVESLTAEQQEAVRNLQKKYGKSWLTAMKATVDEATQEMKGMIEGCARSLLKRAVENKPDKMTQNARIMYKNLRDDGMPREEASEELFNECKKNATRILTEEYVDPATGKPLIKKEKFEKYQELEGVVNGYAKIIAKADKYGKLQGKDKKDATATKTNIQGDSPKTEDQSRSAKGAGGENQGSIQEVWSDTNGKTPRTKSANPETEQLRYTFTIDANGKTIEELEDSLPTHGRTKDQSFLHRDRDRYVLYYTGELQKDDYDKIVSMGFVPDEKSAFDRSLADKATVVNTGDKRLEDAFEKLQQLAKDKVIPLKKILNPNKAGMLSRKEKRRHTPGNFIAYYEAAVTKGYGDKLPSEFAKLYEDCKKNRKSYSAPFGVDVMGVRVLPRDKMTEKDVKLQEVFEDKFGAQMIFFEHDDKNFNGFYRDGVIYVNKNAQKDDRWIVSHELMHHLMEHEPVVFREVLAELERKTPITDKQIEKYRKRIYNGDKLSRDDIVEEMAADAMHDIVKQTSLLEGIAKENPTMAERIVEVLNSIVQKMKELVYTPLGLSSKQGKALENAVFRLAGELKDANGNRLFSKKGGFLSNVRTNLALDENVVTDTVADKDGMVKHLNNVMDNLFGKVKYSRQKEQVTDDAKFQVAYHGSPHIFEAFDLSAIGSGEGAQAHGWGLYFAQNEDVSKGYRNRLSGSEVPRIYYDGKENKRIEKIVKRVLGFKIRYWTDENLGEMLEKEYPKDRRKRDIETTKEDIALLKKQLERLEHEPNFNAVDFLDGVDKGARFFIDDIITFDGKIDLDEVTRSFAKKQLYREYSGQVEYLKDHELLDSLDFKKLEFTTLEGSLMEVDIPEDDVLLYEDLSLSKQPLKVKKALGVIGTRIKKGKFLEYGGKTYKYEVSTLGNWIDTSDNKRVWYIGKLGKELDKRIGASYEKVYVDELFNENDEGRTIYSKLVKKYGSPKKASEILNEHGIKGITYDGRRDGRCFVVFDDKAIEIKRKYDSAIKENKPIIKRSLDDIKAEVKKAFPNAKSMKYDGNDIIVTMPNGAKVLVRVRDKIIVNDKAANRAREAHGVKADEDITIGGYWQKVSGSDIDGVLGISQESAEGTAYHESLHMAMDLALTPKEKKALTDHYAKKAKAEGMDVEEAIANGYADWKVEREKGSSTPLGKLFQKMQDFWYRLKSVFTGIENLHDVLRRVESGEVWKREADNPQVRLKRDEEAFGKLVDTYIASDKKDWKQKNDGKLYRVMDMPLVLQMLDAPDMTLSMYGSGFKHILRHAGMDESILKQLPSQLADPIMVVKSRDEKNNKDKFVSIIELKDKNGATVIVPLEFDKLDDNHGIVSVINSMYGRSNKKGIPTYTWFKNRLEEKNVLYVNKKKSTRWAQAIREEFPVGLTLLNGALSDSSIKHEGDLVKLKNEFPTKYSGESGEFPMRRGNGYHGFSKSNNAIYAEDEGKFPATVAAKKLGVKAGAIKHLLEPSEWHHTGKMYNKTDYYDVSGLLLYKEGGREALVEEGFEKEEIDSTENLYKQLKEYKEPAKDEKLYRANVEYLEWGGTRRHPLVKEHRYKNIPVREKGSFYTFTLPDGTTVRKKIGSNGTEVSRLPDIAKLRENEVSYRDTLSKAGEQTLAFAKENADYDMSMSGTVYPKGKKPTRAYRDNPSEFFSKGDRVLREDGRTAVLQEWDGNDWVTVETSKDVTPSAIMYAESRIELIDEYDKPIKYSLFKKSDVPHSTRVMRIIEKGTGVKIAWGHTRDNVNVYYDEANRVIRSRDANNFRVVIPKVAEVYCNMLNVGITNNNGRRTLDPAMRDYVNDFILTGAGNRANTREARAFERAMRNNPTVAENIMDLRAEFERYNQLSDAEKAMETIKYDTGKPITKKRIKAGLERLVSRFVDEQLPIYNLSVELAKRVKDAGGKLRASADPYIGLRVAKGAMSQAARMVLPPQGRIMAQTSTNKAFIKREIDATKAMLRRNFPSVPSGMIDNFKPLWLILQDANVKEGDKSYQKLTTYLVAKRMLGIHNRREREWNEKVADLQAQHPTWSADRIDQQAERELREERNEKRYLNQALDFDGTTIADDATELWDFAFPPEYNTREKCTKIINELETPAFRTAARELYNLQNTMLEIRRDAGMLSAGQVDGFRQRNEDYIPLHREIDEDDFTMGDSSKAQKGSSRTILEPLAIVGADFGKHYVNAAKNKAMMTVGCAATTLGNARTIEVVDNNRPQSKNVVSYFVNGRRVYLEAERNIAAAIASLTKPADAAWFMKLMAKVSHFSRDMLTAKNPQYGPVAFFRDLGDFVFYKMSPTELHEVPLYLAKAFKHVLTRDALFSEYGASGASQSVLSAMDKEIFHTDVVNLDKSQMSKYKKFINTFINAIEYPTEVFENVVRVAAYEHRKDKTLKEELANGRSRDRATGEAMLEATYHARDLLDFAVKGEYGARLNTWCWFANAVIQGGYKMVRAFDWRDPRNLPKVKGVLFNLGLCATAQLIFSAMGGDDDDIQGLSDADRYMYYHIPIGDDFIFRMPKPDNGAVRGACYWIDIAMAKRKVTPGRTTMPIENMLPSVVPSMALPVIETMANYSFFYNNAIVPANLQNTAMPEKEYDYNTSETAKAIGKIAGWSPKKIDYIGSKYLGFAGRAVGSLVDKAVADKEIFPMDKSNPVIRRFAVQDGKANVFVGDAYEKIALQKEYFEDWKERRKQNPSAKPHKDFDRENFAKLKVAEKRLKMLTKAIRENRNNTKISREEQKKINLQLTRERNKLAEKIVLGGK